jgi:hypothetical protein
MRTANLFASLACSVLLAASAPDDYRVSGPYTHDNLSIFLIHGKSGGRDYLTLKDALEQKKVVVYETHNVNELAIENLSDKDVFVQGGDIVKGGQQDRVISNDFVLPAKSGRLPISAFCVEPGRWTQRGAESAARFSVSTDTVVNKDMAIAVKEKKNQAEVWKEVAKAQAGLAGGVSVGTATQTVSVQAESSPSSLQLTLESRPVEKATEGYLKSLKGVVDHKPNVVGFAFAVNGQINSADIYASTALFAAMWPKLLKSSAVEAVRVRQKDQKFSQPPASAVEALLQDQEGAKTSTVNVGRVALVSREAEKQLMFESRDGDSWIHRNYIAK